MALKILADGTVEGTPEELAAYELAKQHLIDISKRTVPAPLPWPAPEPNKVVEPWIGDPPGTLGRFDVYQPSICESCRNGGVCGCILSNPGVRC